MDILKKYCELKSQVSQLTKQIKDLEYEATEEFSELEQSGTEVKFDFGTPYWTKRESWQYSDKVKAIEEKMNAEIDLVKKKFDKELSDSQLEEIKAGTAKLITKRTLSFRSK